MHSLYNLKCTYPCSWRCRRPAGRTRRRGRCIRGIRTRWTSRTRSSDRSCSQRTAQRWRPCAACPRCRCQSTGSWRTVAGLGTVLGHRGLEGGGSRLGPASSWCLPNNADIKDSSTENQSFQKHYNIVKPCTCSMHAVLEALIYMILDSVSIFYFNPNMRTFLKKVFFI